MTNTPADDAGIRNVHPLRTWSVLAFALLAGACSPQPPTLVATIELENASEAETLESANVLLARFRQIAQSGSTVHSAAGASMIELTFFGEPPNEETIRTYAATQGIYRMYPANSPATLLLTDRDIESAQPYSGQAGIALDLTVRETAAKRLQAYTSRNLGRVLVTTWDRKELSRATIQGAFSDKFQTTGLDQQTVMRLAVVLRHGRLPVRARVVGIHRPAP